MLIARLIRSDTVLYRKISERIGVLDSVFLMRPTLIFPVWIMIAAGMGAGRALAVPELYWIKELNWQTIVYFLGLTLMAGSTILRFQIRNRPGNERGKISPNPESLKINLPDVKRLAARLMAAGLILATGVSLYALIMAGAWVPLSATVWAVLAALTWMVFQTGDSLQRHARPVLGVVSTILTGFFLFLIGWAYASGPLGMGLFHAVPYVLLFAAVATITIINGRNPFALRFGVRITMALGTVWVAGALVIGFLLEDPVISTGSMLALPFFVLAVIFIRKDHIERAIRYPVLIMAIFVSVRYPWLFVALTGLFYVSRLYYYFRFNLDYPTFHVDQE